jgi:hypothetical protein
MKNVKLFLLLATGIIMSGCHNDDDKNGNTGLNGTWYLVKAVAPETGTSEDFGRGTIKWRINTSNQKVVVDDTREITTANVSFYNLPDGTYNYYVSAWGGACDNAFHIEELNFGCITLDGDSLTLTTEAADGVRYSFVR